MGRILFAFAFIFFAFSAQAQEAKPMLLPMDKEPLTFTTSKGKVSFGLEVAATDEEHARADVAH